MQSVTLANITSAPLPAANEMNFNVESAKRRRRHKNPSIIIGRTPLSEHQQKQFIAAANQHHHHHQYHFYQQHHPISDCDNGHSSYEDDDSVVGMAEIDIKRYGRRKRKIATITTAAAAIDAGVVIPRSIRIQQLLDGIRLEIQKAKSEYTLSLYYFYGQFINAFLSVEIDGSSNLLKVNPSLIDSSDFNCVLCLRTLWNPVVTQCGHTYCLVSLSIYNFFVWVCLWISLVCTVKGVSL